MCHVIQTCGSIKIVEIIDPIADVIKMFQSKAKIDAYPKYHLFLTYNFVQCIVLAYFNDISIPL